MQENEKDSEFIDSNFLCKKLMISRTTLQAWLNDEKVNFPRPFKINRRLLWKRSEIDNYIESTRQS